MLLGISLLFIVLLASIVVYYTNTKRRILIPMTGMMISMANGMMTSIAFGTIMGVYVIDKDLSMPTIAAVVIGMIAGYLTGRPISLIAALDGLTAGIMGGMMGAMLGVMLQPKYADYMIYFIDIISLIVFLILFRIIDEETRSNRKLISKPFKTY